MILSGLEIINRQKKGDIHIDNFDEALVGPNSYNLRLHNEMLVYEDSTLDMKKKHSTKKIIIPEEGYVLQPGKLYLARTKERTATHNLVPMLEGRSSVGRLGIFIHVTAGFGDVGFDGYWTLEIMCIHPVRIYAGVEIGQIYYHTIEGDPSITYSKGKYFGNREIQASKLYEDFAEGGKTPHIESIKN